MIKSVTVINYLGEQIKMELRRPDKSGFLIRDITGLGPPKANINSTENPSDDGAVFNSARLESRNIVMSMILLPHPTIEDTRQSSYKFFPIKRPVTLVIETDRRLCEITGYVESNTPEIFSKQESIQVSIICHDPYFHAYGESGVTTTTFYTVEAQFEFPLCNDSLEDKLLEFGVSKQTYMQTVYYSGDSEVGMDIMLHAVGEASNVNIINVRTRESMRIDTDKLQQLTGASLQSGDSIMISTVKRRKSAVLLRNGVYTNVLNCINRDADWLQIAKGENKFAYTVETGAENVWLRIENSVVFEGV